MIRFLKALVLLPVAIVVVLLAVANRDPVSLSFDPFSPAPVFSAVLPLYVIVFGAVALGILLGGVGAWLGQGTARRRARYYRREAERKEQETTRLRAALPPEPGYRGTGGAVALPAPR